MSIICLYFSSEECSDASEFQFSQVFKYFVVYDRSHQPNSKTLATIPFLHSYRIEVIAAMNELNPQMIRGLTAPEKATRVKVNSRELDTMLREIILQKVSLSFDLLLMCYGPMLWQLQNRKKYAS